MKLLKVNNVLKFILFFKIAFFVLEGHCQSIEYTISTPLIIGEANAVQISMSFCSDDTGVTKLLLPTRWTDAENLFKNIVNINLDDKDRQDVKIIDGFYPYEKYIISKPNTNIYLTYHLISNNQHDFAPHINKNYFSFIGKTAFIIPKFQIDNEIDEINLKWDIPLEKNTYKIVNSYGLDQIFQKMTIDDLLEGIFMGGDLYISSIEGTKNKVIFAYNKSRSHAQSKWEKDAAYLISSQRRAVNDNHIPYYLVL